LTFSASAVGTAVGFLSGGIIAQNYYVEFDRVDADRFVSLLDIQQVEHFQLIPV
jgi:hypothetical protein